MENTSNSSGQSNTGSQSNSFNMDNLSGMLGNLNIPESLKKYGGSATKAIGNLTTTQKVLGGAALLLGASYLMRKKGGLGILNQVGAMANRGKKKNR